MKKIAECIAILALIFISGTTVMAQTEIRTVEELAAIGSSKNALEESYILMNDITVDNWIPIGGVDFNEDGGFSGVFDGNGHTVTINSFDQELDNTRVGLFGVIEEKGVVKNLHITGKIDYTGGQKYVYIGGIAGLNDGLITCCVSSIDLNCGYIKLEKDKEKKIKGPSGYEVGNFAGGITGANLGIITHCYSTGSISVFQGHAGGITGGNGRVIYGSFGISVGSGGVGMTASPGAAPKKTGYIAFCYSSSSLSSVVDNTGRGANRYLLGSAGGIAAAHWVQTSTISNCISLNRLIEAKGETKPKASPFPRHGALALSNMDFQYYYLEGVVTRRYNAKGKELSPEKEWTKHAVSLSEIETESWWRRPDGLPEKGLKKVIGFPFGEDEESPWKWNDTLKRPVLYWETDSTDIPTPNL